MEGLSQRCPLPAAAQGCPRPGRGTALLVLTLLVLVYPLLQGLAVQLHSALTGRYIPGTHSIAFVNCLNEQIARDIARAIMDKRLAACVNILPKSSALYFWKGELEESTEILLIHPSLRNPRHRQPAHRARKPSLPQMDGGERPAGLRSETCGSLLGTPGPRRAFLFWGSGWGTLRSPTCPGAAAA
ncbi:protein CutA isoform X1 [Hirundo rustica]|uniref:protein CutA isoform X1 n=1 Tax=Hirundo rustica TaxID=43150 RepID=UPI001A953789|nr:protein CutA isoform X1 [Hirundo rustica]